MGNDGRPQSAGPGGEKRAPWDPRAPEKDTIVVTKRQGPPRTIQITDETEKKRILKERARKLARPPEDDTEIAAGYLPVTVFMLGYERYAIEMSYIREVYPLKDLTPVTMHTGLHIRHYECARPDSLGNGCAEIIRLAR